MNGEKIKLARKRMGLSLRDLSKKMHELVSAQAIGKYERDEMTPSSDVLIALSKSLNVGIDYLMSPNTINLGEIKFRKAQIGAKDRSQVEYKLRDALERYLQIESILNQENSQSNDQWQHLLSSNNKILEVFEKEVAYNSPISFEVIAEQLANSLRKEWNLGLDPISNMTELLEERGFKVLLEDLANKVSGLTCLIQNQNSPLSVILLNKNHNLERRRFTMAHELGHFILEKAQIDAEHIEKACNRFAGAFLVNSEHLKQEVGKLRNSLSYNELITLKHLYGVSACALLMRLEQVGIIAKSAIEYLFRTIARDWRKNEPEPLEAEENKGERENPTRFERLVYRALAEDMISPMKAAELLQKSITEVEAGLKGPAMGHESYC